MNKTTSYSKKLLYVVSISTIAIIVYQKDLYRSLCYSFAFPWELFYSKLGYKNRSTGPLMLQIIATNCGVKLVNQIKADTVLVGVKLANQVKADIILTNLVKADTILTNQVKAGAILTNQVKAGTVLVTTSSLKRAAKYLLFVENSMWVSRQW